MRELHECQAEVFRRSEKRIKERKRNRNRTLALCLLLCLVLAVWSVVTLPSMLPANNKNSAADGNPEAVGGLSGNSAKFISVSVAGIGNAPQTNILVDDANKVAQIYYSIDSAFVCAGEGDNKHSAGNEATEEKVEDYGDDFSQSESTNLASGYMITFTTGTGTQSVYTLNGYVLTDNSTNKSVTLTDAQRSQLLDNLGLVITWEEEPQ